MKGFSDISLSPSANISVAFKVNEEGTILWAAYKGIYGHGSSGNADAEIMFRELAAAYFTINPITIVLDLRELEYTWGNTILKVINFFNEVGRGDEENEKKVIYLLSEKNSEGILGLVGNDRSKLICKMPEQAVDLANSFVKQYLDL